MAGPRIVLAEDHPDLLKALRNVIGELGEVVGAVTDGQALVHAAQRLKPDIVFTDIAMPGMNGLDATRILQALAPESRVIIVTSYQEPAYVTLAFEAGARGYILKKTALHAELSQALLHVLAGDCYVGLGVRGEWEAGGRASTSGLAGSGRPSMRMGSAG